MRAEVLFLPVIGSVAWLLAGRPQASPDLACQGNRGPAFLEYERPGRYIDPDPERDAAYQQSLRDRAEEQCAVYRARQRKGLGGGDQPGA